MLDLLLLKWNFLTSKQVTRKFDVTQCLSVVFCLFLLLSHESGWPFVKYLPSQILTQQNFFFFQAQTLKKKFFCFFYLFPFLNFSALFSIFLSFSLTFIISVGTAGLIVVKFNLCSWCYGKKGNYFCRKLK